MNISPGVRFLSSLKILTPEIVITAMAAADAAIGITAPVPGLVKFVAAVGLAVAAQYTIDAGNRTERKKLPDTLWLRHQKQARRKIGSHAAQAALWGTCMGTAIDMFVKYAGTSPSGDKFRYVPVIGLEILGSLAYAEYHLNERRRLLATLPKPDKAHSQLVAGQ